MEILKKEILSDFSGTRVVAIRIASRDIAEKARPGQFVAVMASSVGERIPLTIVDTDRRLGTITLIFQEIGLTTKLLGKLNPGDRLYALVGPLGHPTEIKNYGSVVLIGGGVGIAEIYPVAKALKDAGNSITVILGSRTKELLMLEKELKAVSDKFYVTTDDGSYGEKGFVTDVLKRLLTNSESLTANYELIYAVGPIPMMKRVASLSQPFNVRTIVSLNALMVDATGMCGCCRITVGGAVKFSCIDGPEFDAHGIDWDELEKRNRIYDDKERHACKILDEIKARGNDG